jgi:O-antigen ligase
MHARDRQRGKFPLAAALLISGLRAAALLCLFATTLSPLIVATGFMWPFVESKALWFRGTTGLAFVCWLTLCFVTSRWRLRFNPILGLFAAVVAALLLADVLAPIPVLSFFGRTERMEGFFGIAYLFLFALTATALLDTEAWRRRFVAACLGVSVLLALVSFWQFYMFTTAGRPEMQVFSTLGNPTYLAQYAAFMICLSFWRAAHAGWRSRLACIVVGVLNLAVLYLTQGRAAALALVGAGVAVAVLAADRDARRGVLAGVGGAAILLIAVPLLHDSLPWLPRYRFFLDFSWDDPRIVIWKHALTAIPQRPWLGWGQEGMLTSGGWMMKVDRAHNLVLDWLVQAGVLGLTLWLSLLGFMAYRVWETHAGVERAALCALLMIYFLTDMVLFDTLTSYFVLALTMVLVGSRPVRAGLQRQRQWSRQQWLDRAMREGCILRNA